MARHRAIWIIVAGAVPTAFRSKNRDDLLPTLHQLQRKQPNVALMWFDRGRFWNSPEEARNALRARRAELDGRGSAWRPGGRHEDPREKYKKTRDEKRAKFKRNLARGPRPPDSKPGGGPPERSPEPPGAPGRKPPAKTGLASFRPPRPPDQRRPVDRKPPAGGRRPWSSAAGQPARSGKPGGQDRKPGGGPRRPWGGERRPSGGGWKPPGGDRKPPSTGRKPPGTGRKPQGVGRKPSGGYGGRRKPPGGGRKK